MSAAKYKLKHPVTYKEGDKTVTVTELYLRRPTGRDLLLIDSHQNQPMALAIEMIEALTDGAHPQIGYMLDAADIGPLADLAFASVEGGPKIGATA